MDELIRLPGALLPWYKANKRDLPWRRDREPYHVWLSEIMLQQTRVEAVKGYYSRFLAVLPTIDALAVCDDDTLHKLWEGLGYYSRVRNLKKAAQIIMNEYGGIFPDQPAPAVDGNVLRVMSRLQDDATPIDLPARKKGVQNQLAAVYPAEAGGFTQALMELGATICGPNKKPDCENCPCKAFCLGFLRGTAEQLPVKSPKKSRRQEDLTVFILRLGDSYALEKRPETGLLAGLWQFPNTPGKLDAAGAVTWAAEQGLKPADIRRISEKKHIFTHIQWNMTGIYMEISEKAEHFLWFTGEEIESNAALPTAFRQFWEERDYV